MRAGSDYPVRRGVRDAARLRPGDVQARDGVHDDEDAAGVQLPLLPLPALRAPFGDMHSRMPPPHGASSALRDTGLFIFWEAYCLWFVPLLRMFRGTAGWRRACACARDTDEASTRAHTAHRPTRSTLRETRGASHVKTKAARRGVRACGSARGRGRCGCRGACSSSSPQSARHTNGAGTSICVSCREPSCVVVEGGRKGFLYMRFCFAVCPPSPPHLRCFRANGSEVDSPR